MMLKNLLILSSLVFTSCVSPLRTAQKRPFRVGIIKMSPDLDEQKPVAPADAVGWVAHSGYLVGAIDSKTIVAVSVENKKRLWTLTIDSALSVPAFAAGDSVIFARIDGTVMKVELASGRVLWQNKPGKSFVASGLAKDNEHLFAATASQVLYAINLQDGKVDWVYDPEIPEDMLVQNTAPPLLSIHTLYWGLSTGELVALEAKTGKTMWRRNPHFSAGGGRFHNYMASMFLSGKRLLFCRYDGLVGAVSTEAGKEGELLWKLDSVTGNCTSADYREGRFYVSTTTGNIHAVSVSSGKELWPTLKLTNSLASVSAVEDFVFATGIDGQLFALNPSGAIAWQDDINARTVVPPVTIGDRLYFASGLKNIYVYRF